MSESKRGSRNKKLVTEYLESLLTDVDDQAFEVAAEVAEVSRPEVPIAVAVVAEIEETIIDIDSLEITEGVDLEQEARNLLSEVESEPNSAALVEEYALVDPELLEEQEPVSAAEQEPSADKSLCLW